MPRKRGILSNVSPDPMILILYSEYVQLGLTRARCDIAQVVDRAIHILVYFPYCPGQGTIYTLHTYKLQDLG